MAGNMLDPRIVRVGIEVQGKLRLYEGLWVTVQVQKFCNPLQNEAQIQIANLSKEVRDYILTETSPYNRMRSRKRCVIYAGRESFGVSQIYSGDIYEASITQPPDIVLTLKCKTGWALKGSMVGYGLPSVSSLSDIAKQTSVAVGMPLQFEATEKNVSNFNYTGSAAKSVDALHGLGGIDAYIDDDKLIVKDKNKALNNTDNVLSLDTGLIGIPEPTDQGVKIKYLFDPYSKLGGQITLKSQLNPALSGKYIIYQLTYELASRDTPFYCIVACRRQGFRYGLY